MIQKLINGAWMIVACVCVGTIISQAIMLIYLVSAWKIDHQRWVYIVAAAKGIAPADDKEAQAKGGEEKVAEMPSYDQILETRAVKYRNLEIREQELRDSFSQLQNQEAQLTDDKKHYKQLREAFDAQLLAMREGSLATGKDEVRRTLESIKPKQAKALILEMLDNKEIEEVVALLGPMADTKRAKIIGEFKTPEELEKLSEVLRRIREGSPSASVSESTRKQLEEMSNPQL